MQLLASLRFTFLLLAAVGLAMLLPSPGSKGGLLRPELTQGVAVFLIFFFNGLTLKSQTIPAGLVKWRVHVFVQAALFLVGPALAWLIIGMVPGGLPPGLALGIFYLGALPCAISTCVVFSTAAGGDTTTALFNSTLSNLAGVLLVPIWMATQIDLGENSWQAVGQMVQRTALTVFPPLLLGQLLRIPLLRAAQKHSGTFGRINSFFILFLTYLAFSQTVTDGHWERWPMRDFVVLALAVMTLMVALMLLAWGGVRLAGFNRADSISAFFCSSLKTLAAGIPLADAVFRGTGVETGLVILPIMLYSLISLAIGSVLVRHLAGQRPQAKA